jgi:hypothetical protein
VSLENTAQYQPAGMCIGWKNRPQAEAAAIEILRDAGYRLAKHWGLV